MNPSANPSAKLPQKKLSLLGKSFVFFEPSAAFSRFSAYNMSKTMQNAIAAREKTDGRSDWILTRQLPRPFRDASAMLPRITLLIVKFWTSFLTTATSRTHAQLDGNIYVGLMMECTPNSRPCLETYVAKAIVLQRSKLLDSFSFRELRCTWCESCPSAKPSADAAILSTAFLGI